MTTLSPVALETRQKIAAISHQIRKLNLEIDSLSHMDE